MLFNEMADEVESHVNVFASVVGDVALSDFDCRLVIHQTNCGISLRETEFFGEGAEPDCFLSTSSKSNIFCFCRGKGNKTLFLRAPTHQTGINEESVSSCAFPVILVSGVVRVSVSEERL